MSAERVEAIGPVNEPPDDYRNHRNQRSQESLPANPPQPRAERPSGDRIQRLRRIADTLLRETETLARDKAFTDESNRLRSLSVSEGIDFYREVERLETGLIKLALDQTNGHQARAAKLLHINATTLNSKIKLYGIEY